MLLLPLSVLPTFLSILGSSPTSSSFGYSPLFCTVLYGGQGEKEKVTVKNVMILENNSNTNDLRIKFHCYFCLRLATAGSIKTSEEQTKV